MAYPTEFLDEIRARTSLESVISRKVKLTRRGRELLGLCPFHNEKTPSFTVVEEKGFYHCFGCGAHGDVIRFVMENDSLPFYEAVEKLAAEVGLPLPKFTAEDIEAEKKRTSLYDVMAKASDWFIARLNTDEGKAARNYLKGRGLSQDIIQRFSLGLAPSRKTALKEALQSRAVKHEELIACGLLIEPEDKSDTFDRFRNRLMFPILDARGRTIAFGGRTLDDAPAKYLNSPETALFHKGKVLYNHAGARKAAVEANEVIVVEGYMDVIALAEAGFENTVAPLGTALTEDQLYLLWRLAPEPVLCFDGDTAGMKAAVRAMERALPLLKAGRSLKFVMLPEGEDPDTLVRREGRASFRMLTDKALPLADLLWQTLTEREAFETPEQRAGLERKVFTTLNQIKDERVKGFYRSDFGKRLNQKFRATPRPGRARRIGLRPKPFKRKLEKSHNLLKTQIGRARGNEPVATSLEELILLAVLNHPRLAHNHFENLSSLVFQDQDLARLQKAILDFSHEQHEINPENLKEHLLNLGFAELYKRLSERSAVRNVRFAKESSTFELAEKWWHKTLERLQQISTLRKDFEELEKDCMENPDEQKWQRLTEIKTEIDKIVLNEEYMRDYELDSTSNMII